MSVDKTRNSTADVAEQRHTTVRDCLTWYRAMVDDETRQPKPLLPTTHDAKMAELKNSTVPQVHCHMRDEETAGEALRGWPRHCRQTAAQKENITRDGEIKQALPGRKTGKKGGKESNVADNGGANIGDLLSQKYLDDYVTKHVDEQRRKKQAHQSENRRRAVNMGKPNKTAQLRSIAVANKLATPPPELWKMPKFTGKAQPRVQTTQVILEKNNTKQRSKQDSFCCDDEHRQQSNYDRIVLDADDRAAYDQYGYEECED